jgi:hypothetical protein
VNNRRLAMTGLSVLAAASLALTACESGTTKASGTPSGGASTAAAPVDASAALTAALADLATTGFDYTTAEGASGGDGLTGGGTFNPATKSASLTEQGTEEGTKVEIGAVRIDTALYAKVDLGPLNATFGLPNTWMTIDTSKVTGTSLPFSISSGDLLDLAGVFTSVSDVKMTDPTTITGTVDLTKATGTTAPDVSADGTKAATTPFTAKMDAQGHLTSLAVDTSAFDKANSATFTFSNYGSPSAITAPSGATPAPDSAYTFLNQS